MRRVGDACKPAPHAGCPPQFRVQMWPSTAAGWGGITARLQRLRAELRETQARLHTAEQVPTPYLYCYVNDLSIMVHAL